MELASFVNDSPRFLTDGRIHVSSVPELFNKKTVKKGRFTSIEDGRLDAQPNDITETVRTIVDRQQSTAMAFYYPEGQRDPREGWKKNDAINYIKTLAQYKQTHNPWIIKVIKDPETRLNTHYILDAGHRFYNLMWFLEDGFPVQGRYWSQWELAEKQNFFDVRIQCIMYHDLSEEEACEIMRLMNTHLTMSNGEKLNVCKHKKDAHVLFCDGLFKSSVEDLLYSRFLNDKKRSKDLDTLCNLSEKYMRLVLHKPVTCVGGLILKNLSELNDFFMGDEQEKKQIQAALIEHTIKVFSLFPEKGRRVFVQTFDMYMVFSLVYRGVIADNQITKSFFEAVYNPNIADGLWFKKWREPEFASGHGSEADKIRMKTKIYHDFCTQFSNK